MSFIRLVQAGRRFQIGHDWVEALKATDLTIEAGELIVFLGPSGSGKTTLLNLIAGIDQPSFGQVIVNGVDLVRLNRRGRLEFRRQNVAVVFQFHNLIPSLTARENVQLVADLVGGRGVDQVLAAVGLSHRHRHFPHELSGGEQQRVAVARALVKNSPLLLGDEPTGNLDETTGRQIVKLFCEVQRQGTCVLLVTHNAALARVATRVIALRHGQIVSDVVNPHPADPDEVEW